MFFRMCYVINVLNAIFEIDEIDIHIMIFEHIISKFYNIVE